MTTSTATPAATPSARTNPQRLALGVAGLFVLMGILGFLITGLADSASSPDQTVLGLAITPLYNVVHLLAGAAGILLASTSRGVTTYGWLLVISYSIALFSDFFLAEGVESVILDINVAESVLHGTLVLLGLVMVVWSTGKRRDPGHR